MSRHDVVDYYLEQQGVYFEMRDNMKEFDKALKGGFIEQETFDQAQREVEVVKNNYERLSYIMLLLNKPKDKSGKARYDSFNRSLYDSLKEASRKAVLDESQDALSDLRKLLKEEEEKNGRK